MYAYGAYVSEVKAADPVFCRFPDELTCEDPIRQNGRTLVAYYEQIQVTLLVSLSRKRAHSLTHSPLTTLWCFSSETAPHRSRSTSLCVDAVSGWL